jgi:hypothetical protein
MPLVMCPTGTSGSGQREEAAEQPPADRAVQAADADGERTAAHRQIGHVERLGGVARVAAPEPQKLVHADAELRHEVADQGEVLADQAGVESIVAGAHRGVRCEDVAGPRRPQRFPEGQAGPLHERARPLEHGEGGVALVQMVDLRLEAEGVDEARAADAQHDLLHQAHLAAAAVQLSGDAAVDRAVQRFFAVQQVQGRAADLRLPHAQEQCPPGKLDRHSNLPPSASTVDRQAAGVVVGIGLLLPPSPEHLAEIPFMIQEPDADQRHAQVARRFQVVAGKHAEAAGVERQRLADSEFHAEIGDRAKAELGLCLAAPAGAGQIGGARRREARRAVARSRRRRSARRAAVRDV